MKLTLMGGAMRPLARRAMRRAQDPVKIRRQFNRAARLWFREVPHAQYRESAYRSERDQPALWVSSGPATSDRVLLYLHGGGYLAGSPETHKRLVARLCRMTGMRALLPSYRLAPEHRLPAALYDSEAAFDHLIALGYRPGDIVIGGDSAGGGLALSLLARLCQTGRRPAACFAWSPFCDKCFSGASVLENSQRDHFFPGDRVHDLTSFVLGDLPPDDPRISPLYAEFPGTPPVLLQVSDSEILRDDSVRMAEKLSLAGGAVELQTWPDAPHVWQIFDGWFPEARQAIRETARFLRHLEDQPADN
nr:alpha/beta hydrolase [Thalassovita mangrovi]